MFGDPMTTYGCNPVGFCARMLLTSFCCVLCLQQPDGGGSYGSMGFTAVEMARKAHHDLPN
jgi:hypothetical protein